jgi:hypothetical protein
MFAFAARAAVFRMIAAPSQMFGAGGPSEKKPNSRASQFDQNIRSNAASRL